MNWAAGRAVHATTGQMPGLRFCDALAALREGVEEDFGAVSLAHCQLCPQSFGELSDEVIERLVSENPGTQFRLHANVRPAGNRARAFDASTQGADALAYFGELAAVSRALGARVYTLHAGERVRSTLAQACDFARRLADLFGHPVGIEGMYPEKGRKWLVDSWEEYAQLMVSVPYALDLSHLHILAVRSRNRNEGLVKDLLAHPNCVEVHLSHNSGTQDDHIPMRGMEAPWWARLLGHANPDAVFFSEGNQRRGPEATARVMRKVNQSRIMEVM